MDREKGKQVQDAEGGSATTQVKVTDARVTIIMEAALQENGDAAHQKRSEDLRERMRDDPELMSPLSASVARFDKSKDIKTKLHRHARAIGSIPDWI